QAFVHSLVSSTKQGQARHGCQLPYPVLRQPGSLRAEIHHMRRCVRRLPCSCQRGAQRLDCHHHPGTAAKRARIHGAVIVVGVIARVPGLHLEQSAFLRPPHHADIGALGNKFGKQRHDIDAHGSLVSRDGRSRLFQTSGSQSTTMRPSERSTSLMYCSFTNGSRCSLLPPRTTRTSLAPVATRWLTRPSDVPSALNTSRPSRSAQ